MTTLAETAYDMSLDEMGYSSEPSSANYQISLLKPKLLKLNRLSQLREHGVTTISQLLWWFIDVVVRDVGETNFAMYRHHHQSLKNNKDGILSNMMFSIAQQLARQDPAFYVT